MFYNTEVSPWMRVSPDLQIIIAPGGNNNNDTAIVCGVHVRMLL